MNFRKVFFLVAVIAALLVVLIELGSLALLGGGSALASFQAQAGQLSPGPLPVNPASVSQPAGTCTAYLALIDGFLLFVLVLQGLSLIISQSTAAKIRGVLTFVVSLLWVLASLLLALTALALLFLMLGLFLAAPFGTLVYLVKWGFFPVGSTAALLSVVLVLKLVCGGSLLVVDLRYLADKGLVALFLISILMQVVLVFLQGFLPGVIVSMADALWAIVVAVVALVWALVSLIGSIPAILRIFRGPVVSG